MAPEPQRAKTWSPPEPVGRLDVMVVGDTTFGENYQERRAASGRGNVLERYGYDHGFERLDGLLDEVDVIIANLESTLTTRRSSPVADIRQYLHYSDPDLATKHLLAHGIQAVTLANNHMPDFGEAGLRDTLRALAAGGLIAVGAGRNEQEAREPLRISAELTHPYLTAATRFDMSVFNAFGAGRHFEVDLRAFATADRPGSAKLQTTELAGRIEQLRRERPDELVVVVPHWLRDYRWRSERQESTARRLTAAGADLVIGHGSHMLQEIEKLDGRWVVHGLGNFIFHSPGRYRARGAPPYSLMARLTVSSTQVLLRLYPIVTDNRRTNYQPRPVTAAELEEVWELLLERTNAPAEFRREFELVGTGPYPHLAVVVRQASPSGLGRPQPRPRPRGAAAPSGPAAGGPGSTGPAVGDAAPAGSDSAPGASDSAPGASDSALGASDSAPGTPAPPAPPAGRPRPGRRPRNAELIAAELARRGIDVTWLNGNAMIAETGGVRLGYGYGTSHATGRAGLAAARHRTFARQLLTSAGLDVPRGRTFDSGTDAADAARYARSLGEVMLAHPERRRVPPLVLDARDPDAFRAAWAETTRDGDTRVLVVERFAGTAARFLVVGGRCVAVAGYSGPAVAGPPDPTGAVHPSLRDLAVRAALAFPGLDVAEVTIAARDLGREAKPGRYVVCEVEPVPSLADYAGANGGAGGGGDGDGGADVVAAVVDLHLGVTPPVRAVRRRRRRSRTGNGVEDPPPAFPPVAKEPVGGFYRVDSHLMALALQQRGAEVTWLARRFFVADIGGVRLGYRGAATHATGRFATRIASRKDLARQVLSMAGLEVVEGRAFRRDGYDPAADYADGLGMVVVKPIDGNKGKGVTVGVRDRDSFERAFRRAARYSSGGVLVERMFPGVELRCLVVADRCVAVLRRLPPHVVGNGRDTVEQLIAAKNEARAQNPSLAGCDITMDPHRRDQLRRQGFDLTDVPPEGREIVLDHKSGISTGGESMDVTDDVHPSYAAVAVRATLAVPGLDIAGVDIITVDPRRPAAPGSYVVCEVNHDPGIDIHHYPIHGSPRDVAGAIVDAHLSRLGMAPGARGRRGLGRRLRGRGGDRRAGRATE